MLLLPEDGSNIATSLISSAQACWGGRANYLHESLMLGAREFKRSISLHREWQGALYMLESLLGKPYLFGNGYNNESQLGDTHETNTN